MEKQNTNEKMSFFDHIIHGIEVAGNKLPNPFVLFVMVWIFMIVLSQILAGVSAIDPATGETVVVEGMLNADGLEWVLKNMVKNYTKFSPLGTVLVMMIGLGVTTTSGLLNEAMKKLTVVSYFWFYSSESAELSQAARRPQSYRHWQQVCSMQQRKIQSLAYVSDLQVLQPDIQQI